LRSGVRGVCRGREQRRLRFSATFHSPP
jgi:hypothetical protein